MVRPLVLGHRGAPARAPENTMESFARALDLGADGFEFDVRQTGDGRLVVIHDPRLGRRSVACCDYADLRALPLLDAVLSEFGSAWLDIELKVGGIEETVLDLAARYCRPGRFVITSFARSTVARIKELDSRVPAGWLFRHPVAAHLWQEMPLDFLAPHYSTLRPALMEAARRHGLRVVTWTANTPRVLRRVLDLGVDAVISDYPDRVLELLGR